MKRNVIFRILALGCAVCGVLISYFIHEFVQLIGSGSVSLPARVVLLIGPFGWLLFSLVTAFVMIRFPGSTLSSILAICFLSASIAAGCILMFTPVEWSQRVARLLPNNSLQPTRGGAVVGNSPLSPGVAELWR